MRFLRPVAALLLAAALAAAEAPPDEKIALAFDNIAVADAMATLAEQLETVIVVDEAVQGSLTLHLEVERERAIYLLAGLATARPRPAIVFCTEDELRGEAELPPDLLERTVDVTVAAETKLADAVEALAGAAETRVVCTEAVGELPVGLAVLEMPLPQVLDRLAEVAECRWTYGWEIVPIEVDDVMRLLDQFLQLPEDQQKQMIDNGLGALLDRYHSFPPEQRRELVSRISGAIEGFGARLRGGDPAMRAQFRAKVGSLIGYGIQRFATFNAQDQAELGPIVRAFGALR